MNMNKEIVLVPMTREQVDYAKACVEEIRRVADPPAVIEIGDLSFDTLHLLRKAADAPRA